MKRLKEKQKEDKAKLNEKLAKEIQITKAKLNKDINIMRDIMDDRLSHINDKIDELESLKKEDRLAALDKESNPKKWFNIE